MTSLFRKKIEIIEGKEWTRMSRKAVEKAIIPGIRVRRYYKCQKYYEAELDKKEFLSVIFLDSKKDTGFLTDDYDTRTIRDVAERMITGGHTFQSLVEKHKLPWYDKCRKIENDRFDYAKFGTIWLRGATEYERCKSPPGKYHIHEGAHRSLVLGKLLREEKEEYCPVRAILIKTTGSTPPDKILD